jgi:hypothetical protein
MEMTRLPELGRFAEPALLILVSLSEGPKHGYAMMADIAQYRRPMGPARCMGPSPKLAASWSR